MRQIEETPLSHIRFVEKVKQLVEANLDKMSVDDFLVCFAQITGNFAAMHASDNDTVMTIIIENIKLGNRAALIKIAQFNSEFGLDNGGKPN